MKKTLIYAAIAMVLIFGTSETANAGYIYDFDVFSNGYENNTDLQFTVEVLDISGQAVFEFKNNSLIDSVITEIYFDDGALDSFNSISCS